MQAVRDDEVAAAGAGVAVFRTKLVGFMMSAAMTALAAVLYMQFYMAIDPEAAFGLGQAIQLQCRCSSEGSAPPPGRSIGGAIMGLLSEVTNWGLDEVRHRRTRYPGLRARCCRWSCCARRKRGGRRGARRTVAGGAR